MDTDEPKIIVVALQDSNRVNLATGIQVIIPAGLNLKQQKAFAVNYIVQELNRYALDEALKEPYKG